MAEIFELGDVICIHGGRGVPKELEDMWYRVVAAEGDVFGVRAWQLDGPYLDQALTRRYHATPPRRRAGTIGDPEI